MFEKSVMGQEPQVSFVGVVESRQDPLALGRVKIRAYAIHSASLVDIPSMDLPWAIVAQATNWDGSPALKEADVVWGVFLDGRSCQIPAVFFKLPGYNQTTPANQGQGFNDLRTAAVLADAPRRPLTLTYNTDGSGITVKNPSAASLYPLNIDLNKPTLSGATRHDIANTIIQTRINNLDKGVITATGLTWSEPYPAYNALYPYNKAVETESGHLFEMDDTPGSERITITHRTGSFIDMYPSGSRVQKITKSNYTVVMGDDYLHVMGRCLITVGQGAYIKVQGDANIEVDNDVNLIANGDFNVAVGGAFNVNAQTAAIITQDDLYLTSQQGQIEVNATGTVDIIGSAVNIMVSAGTGTPNDLEPGARGTPNAGVAGEEPTPVPFPANFQYLDAYTATSVQQNMLLDNGTTPDASVANTPCSFDVNTHTFLPSSDWTLSQAGLQALQQREGYAKALANGSCQAYPDPVLGPSLLTIGYGCTQVVLPYTLTVDTVRTQPQAQQDILNAIDNVFLPKLQEYINVPLTANMVDALLSFMYNVGVGNFSNSSVLKYTNQKNYCAAKASFLLWNRSGGQVIPGLTARRQSESTQYIA